MKSIKFISIFLLFSCSIYSQTNVYDPEKNYLNKSIWSQVFNDFEGNFVIPIVTPWVIAVGTYSYIKTDVFTKDLLKEYDVFSEKDLKFREITNSINNSFVNFIPNDSKIRMRAIYKNRILYNYEVSQTDTTYKVDFNLPTKESGETIVFDKKGKLITYDSFKNYESTSVKNIYFSDSLSIRSTSHSESANDLIEKQQVENGHTVRKTTFKKDKLSMKESFISDIIYKYNKESMLVCQQNLNKKGKTTDSISYYYSQGKISMILQQEDNITRNRIIYNYQKTDTVIKKCITENYSHTITYIYFANRLKQIILEKMSYSEPDIFDFEYNTQGLLMTVSELSGINSKDEMTPRKQYIFSYNENNNIKKVQVINRIGVINKEINFEYDFL